MTNHEPDHALRRASAHEERRMEHLRPIKVRGGVLAMFISDNAGPEVARVAAPGERMEAANG
jgi:hypothetical protein